MFIAESHWLTLHNDRQQFYQQLQTQKQLFPWLTLHIYRVIVIDRCFTARQHRKVNLCQLRGTETGSVG